jgi:hypothetical protein
MPAIASVATIASSATVPGVGLIQIGEEQTYGHNRNQRSAKSSCHRSTSFAKERSARQFRRRVVVQFTFLCRTVKVVLMAS